MTQDNDRSAKAKAPAQDRGIGTSGEQDLHALKRSLQEQRRAFTLMRAEADKERELREALEAQLLEANAEIVASWDRRKEMARVIAEQQAKLADERKEAAALKRAQKKADDLLGKLQQKITNLEQLVSRRDEDIANLKQVVANRDQAIAKRDKVLGNREQVITNREQKISELKIQLRARYEELAALERHIVQSTISGKAKRLARQARELTRKSFQG